jgi:hypothetical protein
LVIVAGGHGTGVVEVGARTVVDVGGAVVVVVVDGVVVVVVVVVVNGSDVVVVLLPVQLPTSVDVLDDVSEDHIVVVDVIGGSEVVGTLLPPHAATITSAPDAAAVRPADVKDQVAHRRLVFAIVVRMTGTVEVIRTMGMSSGLLELRDGGSPEAFRCERYGDAARSRVDAEVWVQFERATLRHRLTTNGIRMHLPAPSVVRVRVRPPSHLVCGGSRLGDDVTSVSTLVGRPWR